MSNAVADRYAQALVELGEEAGQLGPLTEHVGAFAAAYADSVELRNALGNPIINPDQRRAVVQAVATRLGLSPLAAKAIGVIVQRRRLANLPDISRRLKTIADERAGVLRATVTTAVPLSEGFYAQLTQEIAKATSKRAVKLERQIDPTLIAGVVTTIGDNTIDGSLKGALAELEQRLIAAG